MTVPLNVPIKIYFLSSVQETIETFSSFSAYGQISLKDFYKIIYLQILKPFSSFSLIKGFIFFSMSVFLSKKII